MRRILLPMLGLAAIGCVRSDLNDTHQIDCAPGLMVVVANAPLCVYGDGLPETCPDDVPYPLTDGELFYCAFEAQPPGAVVRRAGALYKAAIGADGDALVGQLPADGGPPDLGPPDAAPRPQDLGPPDAGIVRDD